MLPNIDIRKGISLGVILAFLVNSLGLIPLARADDFRLPAPGVMVHLSQPFQAPELRGIRVYPDNPLRFDFILDRGDSPVKDQETTRLIKYFLASLTIPEKDLWVNLSPYEKDRIIPNSFGQTEMGRDLLAEDYMLKQITASLIYPEDVTGKKFWKRVYEEAALKFGTTNIPVNTFNKVWIVPDRAIVYENAQAGTAYVKEATLKVMLDQDYLSMTKHVSSPAQDSDINKLGSKIIREIVIPELTREVNEDKNFAQLRQVYASIILATWYKMKIKDSILGQVYTNQNKIQGIVIPGQAGVQKMDVNVIYQRYLQAFKKGVFNFIKEETDPITQASIPRKYFSGGEMFTDMAMRTALQIKPVSAIDEAQLTTGSNAEIITADLAATASSTKPIQPWGTRMIKDGNHNYIPAYTVGPITLWPIYDLEAMMKKSKAKGSFEEKLAQEIKRLRQTYTDDAQQRYLFVPPISAVPGKPVDSYSLNAISAMLSNQRQFQNSLVIDLGAGSGLLSLVALSMGASRVYLFESDPVLAYIARGILEAQGYRKGKEFEILGSIEDSKKIIASLIAQNKGQRKVIELANLGPWPFYGSANQDALDIFRSNAIDLMINGGYTRQDESKKDSHWAKLINIYYDLKAQGFDCTVIEGLTNRTLVAKRQDKIKDQAMTAKFEDWFKKIPALRWDRERALLDTLDDLSNELSPASDQRALLMNAYMFKILAYGGFVSNGEVTTQDINAASPELGVNRLADPQAQYQQAIEWLLLQEQNFLTRDSVKNDTDIPGMLLSGINARVKSVDGIHVEFKYGWEIRLKAMIALKMRLASKMALTPDEISKIVKTILNNIDPQSSDSDYDLRKESAEMLQGLIEGGLIDPLPIKQQIDRKVVVENLLRGLALGKASGWGLRMQNALALKALVASGLVSRDKGDKILQALLGYLNTVNTDLYGPVLGTSESYSVYNAFADTLNELITGKFVTSKDADEIVSILLRGFKTALAGGEPRETKNEQALAALISDGIVSHEVLLKEIEKNRVIETLLRGFSPDFHNSVRKADADALKTLIDLKLVPGHQRISLDEIKGVMGQNITINGFLPYYLRLLVVLKNNPQEAYQAFDWNPNELMRLFGIFDALSHGAILGDFYMHKFNIKFILEDMILRNSQKHLSDPEFLLNALRDKVKSVINEDSVRINIYADTPESDRSAEKFVEALGLEEDGNVNVYNGQRKPSLREINGKGIIQIAFGNIPRADIGVHGNSYDVLLPNIPSNMDAIALDFGLQMIGARRPLLNEFLKSEEADQAMASRAYLTPFGLLNAHQYEVMVLDPIAHGLSYDEAKVWRDAKIAENIRFPKGLWQNEITARNFIYLALDTIPGFKQAREENNIKVMAELYRSHVIKYQLKDAKKYDENGQLGFFFEVGKLNSLIANSRPFLKKVNSPPSILQFALPGLIDLSNPDALDPLEVGNDYWTDPQNAKFHIYQVLDTIPGFKDARDTNNIKVMAELYRKYVMGYKVKDSVRYNNGQVGFFLEEGGLSSLMRNASVKYLDKKNSPAALLRFALPGLIDEENPDALAPLEVENDYWTDPHKAKERIIQALDTVPGFRQARLENNVKAMAELYRKYVIKYSAVDKQKYSNGQVGFFSEVGGLKGLMIHYREFLDRKHSPAAILRFALYDLIDQSNPDALRLEEISNGNGHGPADAALLSAEKGGIDLTPARMNLVTHNLLGSIKFHLDPVMLQQLQNAKGFVPVIVRIEPLKSLPEFLNTAEKLLDSPA